MQEAVMWLMSAAHGSFFCNGLIRQRAALEEGLWRRGGIGVGEGGPWGCAAAGAVRAAGRAHRAEAD